MHLFHPHHPHRLLARLCGGALLLAGLALGADRPGELPDAAQIAALGERFGAAAGLRLADWAALVRAVGTLDERQRLTRVNAFFNALPYRSDRAHWGRADYWATPAEFLASGAGDCEDYALAKYFTLRLSGVAEDRLRITYVQASGRDEAHMVLAYYPQPDASPLVLDNLRAAILPASARQDLTPVYSFNGAGLWLAKVRGQGRYAGSAQRLSRWTDLLARLAGTAHAAPTGGRTPGG